MPDDTETVIRQVLDHDEQLIWFSQPRLGMRLQLADIFLIPLSVVWTAFMVFGVVSVLVQDADPVIKVFGLIVTGAFFLIGLYLLGGRFWVEAELRRRTHYAVTDRRILIVSGWLRRKVQSISLRTLSDVTMTETRKGTGTITFGPVPPWQQWWDSTAWPGMEAHAGGFRSIDRVGEVYNLILHAQRTAV